MPESETTPKWTLADLLADPDYGPIVKPLLPLLGLLVRLGLEEAKIVIENLQKKKWSKVYVALLPVMNDDERRMLMRQSQTLAYEAAIDQAKRIEEGKVVALRLLLGLLPLVIGGV